MLVVEKPSNDMAVLQAAHTVRLALRALPLTALVDALRAVMLEGRPLSGCAAEVGALAAWTLASFVVALRIFRWV